jgi:PKD repeat protein
MKKLSFCLLIFSFLMINAAISQDTLILQPGPEGKDAFLDDFYTFNIGDYPNMFAIAGTSSGYPILCRSLLEFDLTSIPPGAAVLEAKISLYYANNPANPHYHYGQNEAYLQRVIEPWDEHTVTWYNQPQATSVNQVTLPASTSGTQDYPDVEVTQLIQDIVNDPENSHGILFRLQVEEMYRRMFFASGDHVDPMLRPKLEVVYLNCPLPTVDFEYLADSLTYSFSGVSTSAISWHWDFGDGDTSDLQDPVHTYAEPGFYEVCLHVEDTCYFADHCEEIEICFAPPVAGFTYTTEGLSVDFQDASLVAGEFYWDFGDGYFSSLKNPSHTYDANGIYTVCHTASNSCGDDIFCDHLNLCTPPVTSFEFEVEGLFVYFQNTSLHPTDYFWDFGDGYYSNLENPWHEYESLEDYEVCLTTWNECGNDESCDQVYLASVAVPENEDSDFAIYPNPARDKVFIKTNQPITGIFILYDLSGKEMMRIDLSLNEGQIHRIDMDKILPGIYIIRMNTAQTQLQQKLVVVK